MGWVYLIFPIDNTAKQRKSRNYPVLSFLLANILSLEKPIGILTKRCRFEGSGHLDDPQRNSIVERTSSL